MLTVDCLILEAKQAILEDHHERCQTLLREGRWPEALHQLHITLRSAADLLTHASRLLEEIVAERRKTDCGPISPVSPGPRPHHPFPTSGPD
jgi:hypothetical protein